MSPGTEDQRPASAPPGHGEQRPPAPWHDRGWIELDELEEVERQAEERRLLLCSRCEKEKPAREFVPRPSSDRGRDYYCRECRREYMREYKAERARQRRQVRSW